MVDDDDIDSAWPTEVPPPKPEPAPTVAPPTVEVPPTAVPPQAKPPGRTAIKAVPRQIQYLIHETVYNQSAKLYFAQEERARTEQEVRTMLGKLAELVLFDVRDRGSFERRHVEGAEHLTEAHLGPALRRLAKTTPVLIYCYHGNASQVYAETFADFRFVEVYSVDGGFDPLDASPAGAGGHPGGAGAGRGGERGTA